MSQNHYWRGEFFDRGGIDPRLAIERARLVDQSQVVDKLYNPSQMVDLSQGIDFSRGFDPSRARNFGRPSSLLPGPGVIGLFGLFEGDYRRDEYVGLEVRPSRPRGLLLLGAKVPKKKEWEPRRLAVTGWHGAIGGAQPVVDCATRGEMFARDMPWWM